MAKVIVTAIQKGGVGKSTTVHEIAANLAKMRKRVLVIDLDGQQNLSHHTGADFEVVSIHDVLMGKVSIFDAIQSVNGLDVIIADKALHRADRDFDEEEDVRRLALALSAVKDSYNYILIDTPPALGTLPEMALCAADFVLIPNEATVEGAQGLGQLAESIQKIREQYNPKLNIIGVFMAMFNGRTIFNRAMCKQIEAISNANGIKVLETYIRTSVAVQEAHGLRQSLVEYAPKSKPAQDYKALTKEILKEMEQYV